MASKQQQKDVAVPLVTVDPNGKFIINKEAMDILQGVKNGVSVISIVGLYRSGKSYVMNRLLGRQSGFAVGPTVNPCTKGIYLWGKPIQEGGMTHILIDTEGIGSVQESQTHDAKIFSLAILLSSYFIYNSMGVIDEGALDKLSLVTNLTKMIQVSNDNNKQASKLADYFPSFLWLLRDFMLQLEDEQGNPISSKQYLENALAKRSKDASKNEIRDTITSCFPQRDCFALVRPLTDERALRAIDQVPYEQLRPEFKAQMDALKVKIFKEASVKSINGKPLNGEALCMMIQHYVDALNSNKVPTINSAWSSVCLANNTKLVQAAHQVYKEIYGSCKTLPIQAEELEKLHDTFFTKAKKLFREHVIGDESSSFLAELEEKIQTEYRSILNNNKNASITFCKNLLEELFDPIQKNAASLTYPSVGDFSMAVSAMWKQYQSKAKGPGAAEVAAEFQNVRIPPVMNAFSEQLNQRLKAKYEAELQQLKSKVHEGELKALQLEKKHTEEAAKKDLRIQQLDSACQQQSAQLKQHEATITSQLQQMKQHEQAFNNVNSQLNQAKLAAETNALTAKHAQEQHNQANALLKEAKDANSKLQQEIASLRTQMETSVKTMKNETAGKEAQLLHLQQTIAQKDNEIKNLSSQLQNQTQQAKTSSQKAEEEKQALQKQREELNKVTSQFREVSAALEAEKSAAVQSKKQAEKLEQQVQQLTKELTTARQQHDTDAKRQETMRSQIDLEVKTVREQLNQELQRKDLLAQQLKQKDQKVAELEQEVVRVKSQLNEANTRLAAPAPSIASKTSGSDTEMQDAEIESNNNNQDEEESDEEPELKNKKRSAPAAKTTPRKSVTAPSKRGSVTPSTPSKENVENDSDGLDPNKLTIAKLKQTLTDMGVKLPVDGKSPKKVYVDLYNQHKKK